MGGLVDHVLNVGEGWLYLIVGSLVFVEYLGLLLPGETAAILAGVQASRGQAHLAAVLVVVVVAAIGGSCAGYEVGSRFGQRLLRLKFLARHQHRLGKAMDLLARRGGAAVFLARFVAFFRSVMPALAGMARMRYPRFLAFNVLGGLVWGVMFPLVGYAAGDSYKSVEKTVGKSAAMAAAAVVVVVMLVLHLRKERAESPVERTETSDSV
jgi:membrane protein DedA with SNARE-associated domain